MKLEREHLDALRLLVASTGWREVMKPALVERIKNLIRVLTLLPAERQEPFKSVTDDTVRLTIRELEWWIGAFENNLAVEDHNRRLDELDRQPSMANP